MQKLSRWFNDRGIRGGRFTANLKHREHFSRAVRDYSAWCYRELKTTAKNHFLAIAKLNLSELEYIYSITRESEIFIFENVGRSRKMKDKFNYGPWRLSTILQRKQLRKYF